MDDIGQMKKQVILYGGLVALVCEGVSFFVLGWSLGFLTGLGVGLGVAILNFFILAANLKVMLDSKKQGVSFVGYFARMVIYCAALFFCFRIGGLTAGAGCLLGILATKVPLFYIYAFKTKFNKNRTVSPEVQAMYEEEDRKKEEEFWQGDSWDKDKDEEWARKK